MPSLRKDSSLVDKWGVWVVLLYWSHCARNNNPFSTVWITQGSQVNAFQFDKNLLILPAKILHRLGVAARGIIFLLVSSATWEVSPFKVRCTIGISALSSLCSEVWFLSSSVRSLRATSEILCSESSKAVSCPFVQPLAPWLPVLRFLILPFACADGTVQFNTFTEFFIPTVQEVVPNTKGFYSNMFMVPKKDGG